MFDPTDREQVLALHDYYIGMGYSPRVRIYGVFGWEVLYQGPRRIKSTPLFQVEYSERVANPLRLRIKCASASRLAPLIAGQPDFLQKDFLGRSYRCRGPECDWCAKRKNLGPAEIEYAGERKTVCWYTSPRVGDLNPETARVIRQYAVLHERLA